MERSHSESACEAVRKFDFLAMKRICVALLLLNLCSLLSVSADENVRAAQEKLRQSGFYFGDLNGVYDNQTAAAVTRYQIREGLQITGKLDGPTAQALGTRAIAPRLLTKAIPSAAPGDSCATESNNLCRRTHLQRPHLRTQKWRRE